MSPSLGYPHGPSLGAIARAKFAKGSLFASGETGPLKDVHTAGYQLTTMQKGQ